DPDDFLDRDYFYEVDSFLKNNFYIEALTCNIIYYHEKLNLYKEYENALSFTFSGGNKIVNIEEFDSYIYMSAPASFFKISIIFDNLLQADEDVKPCFEDAKFIAEYLIYCDSNIAFMESARYYYRRGHGSTTSTKIFRNIDYYIHVSEVGVLHLLEKIYNEHGVIPKYIQNIALFHLMWQIVSIVDSPNIVNFMSIADKNKYFSLICKIFYYIDVDIICKFPYIDLPLFYRLGMLFCFKGIFLSNKRVMHIKNIDYDKKIICFSCFSSGVESIKFIIDGFQVDILYEKDIKHNFVNNNVFIYEKIMWIRIYKKTKYLEVLVNNKRVNIDLGDFQHYKISLFEIYKKMRYRPKEELWILTDREQFAGGSAEILYRYIREHCSEINLRFALDINSSDWFRLNCDAFDLLDLNSHDLKQIIQNKKVKIIFSDFENKFIHKCNSIKKVNKQFVYVANQTIVNWLSPSVINNFPIDMFMVSNCIEYKYFIENSNFYKTDKKITKITGIPRMENLFFNNQQEINYKHILIIFEGLDTIGCDIKDPDFENLFLNSLFYRHWNNFLTDPHVINCLKKYKYTISLYLDPKYYFIQKYFLHINFESIECSNINKLLLQSDLLITDFSFFSIDMAGLNKPTLYYQFEDSNSKQYFDLKIKEYQNISNIFSNITYFKEEAIDKLQHILRDECRFNLYYDKDFISPKSSCSNVLKFLLDK
ncbi:CDP-glycerol glycerophosphotransferase family protein, partial [Campylobacter jejuni]